MAYGNHIVEEDRSTLKMYVLMFGTAALQYHLGANPVIFNVQKACIDKKKVIESHRSMAVLNWTFAAFAQ